MLSALPNRFHIAEYRIRPAYSMRFLLMYFEFEYISITWAVLRYYTVMLAQIACFDIILKIDRQPVGKRLSDEHS